MTDISPSTLGAPQFAIGRVLGTSFSVLLRNFVPFMVLAIVCGIPNIVFAYENPAFQRLLHGEAAAAPPAGFDSQRYGLLIASYLVSILCYALTQSSLMFGTVQDLRGQRAGFGAIVSRGIATLVPVFDAALLMTLGFTVGLVLLIVPGIILFTMWWVTIPAIVAERVGVIAAFGRSRRLTEGRRWAILGLFVIIIVIRQLAGLLVGAVFGMLFGVAGGMSRLIEAAVVGGLIVGILFSAYLAVATAVGYFYLRADKEGVLIDDLARVFD
jgi:hypothetical protein